MSSIYTTDQLEQMLAVNQETIREQQKVNADLKGALHDLEVAANTVALCYTKRPANFAFALKSMEEAAERARMVAQ